ncbi:MAG: IPT/TIG domain-containing protein [Bacteroidetes bacterium]|nr:IPT/TIG domain-containing protein [Bacteroidota bacterium]
MYSIIKKQLAVFACIFLIAAAASCRKKESANPYNASAPVTVSGFMPTSGPVGTELLISGSNFSTNLSQLKASINGVPLLIVGASGNQIMAVVSQKTGSGPVVVSVDKNQGTSAGIFNYKFSYVVSTLAGSGNASYADGKGTGASFNFNGVRGQLCVDQNLNVYVADGGNQRIRKIASDGTVSTIAGSGINGYVDGAPGSAQFNNPCGTFIDKNGILYVSERNGRNIRKIATDGTVSTYAHGNGNGGNELTSVVVNNTTGAVYWSDFYGDGIYALKSGSVVKVINHSLPCTICIDAQGNIYSTHYDDQMVIKYAYNATADTFDNGTVVAGTSHVGGMADGVGTAATFSHPWGIAIDAQNNLYVTGQGGGDQSNSVRLISAGTNAVTTIAGLSNNTGYVDGNGTDARFNQPTGVAIDKNGNLYILDMGNNRVRKITVQ